MQYTVRELKYNLFDTFWLVLFVLQRHLECQRVSTYLIALALQKKTI